MSNQALPIPQLFRFAVLTLQISPQEFWRLTPKELLMLVPQGESFADEMRVLQQKFPD